MAESVGDKAKRKVVTLEDKVDFLKVECREFDKTLVQARNNVRYYKNRLNIARGNAVKHPDRQIYFTNLAKAAIQFEAQTKAVKILEKEMIEKRAQLKAARRRLQVARNMAASFGEEYDTIEDNA